MSNPTALVQKLWNYCNPAVVGRNDGLSYGDHVEPFATIAECLK